MSSSGWFVVREGEGTPVVLLHAGAGSSIQWTGFQQHLGDGYRTVAPDLPSHGKTPEPPGVSADNVVALLADGVAALAAAEREPVHLIGHSWGAILALSVAMTHPELLASVTLVEPVCFDALRLAGRLDLYAVARDEAVALAALTAVGEHERAIRLLLRQWGFGIWDVLSERQQRALVRSAPAVIGYGLLGGLRWQVTREALRAVRVPTLVVYGDEGPAACAPIAQLLAREIPGARGECIVGAGHMLPLTDAERFVPLVRGHIERVGQRGTQHTG